MSATLHAGAPWLLGSVGAPVVPPSWGAVYLMAPRVVLVDGSTTSQAGRTMLDLAKFGAGPSAKVPVDWHSTAEAVAATLVVGVPGWDVEPVTTESEDDGFVGDLPLLSTTRQVLSSLGFNSKSPLEVVLRQSRARLLGQDGGALALLDLSVTAECWWPQRDASRMRAAVENASTLEDVADAIVREYLAMDGHRLDDRWVTWILRRFSWGMPGATLEVIGKEADLTRERVRQILVRVSQRVGERVWPLPSVLAHSIEALFRAGFREAQDVLLDSGFVVDDDWTPQEITGLLRWLGYGAAADALDGHFEAAEEKIVADRERDAELKRAIRKARTPLGFVRTDTVASIEGDLIPQATVERLLPQTYARVYRSGPWALVADQSLSTAESITQRQLAVASPLSANEIYHGLTREQKRRSSPPLPPEAVTIELLTQTGTLALKSEGSYAGITGRVDPTTINGWLISVLREADGHVLHKEAINRQAMRDRLNLTSLTVYLSYSFAVRQCEGGGLYRLVGSTPNDDELEHATAVAEAARIPSELTWAVSTGGLDLSLTVGSNLISMGSVQAHAALCRLWPEGGALVHCICNRPFEGRINAHGDAALMNWNTLLTHMVLNHNVREGSVLTIRVETGNLTILRVD